VQEEDEFVNDTEDFVDAYVSISDWMTLDGKYIFEGAEFKVNGEIWRVHKNDPDPFPSFPHAHCVSGPENLKGCKLHLGTGELFRKKQSMGRRMQISHFRRLIQLLQSRFPDIELPVKS
jgi:hypothetical protein